MYNRLKKRRTNLAILSQTLREVQKTEMAQKEPPTINQINNSADVQNTTKPSKREVPIEGNGIIEKKFKKKGPEFINFKNLLTS